MFTPDFIINYNKNNDFASIFVAKVIYSKYLQLLHEDLIYLYEKIVIDENSKLTCTVLDEKIYTCHIRILQ